MTIQNPPIFLQASAHPAEDVRRWISGSMGNRGGVVHTSHLAVTQNGTPNMSVIVAGGQVFIPGTEATYQGLYFGENRGNATVTITASNPTNPRRDLIVARVRDAGYSGATNTIAIEAVAGTPAASPSDPTVPNNCWVLARVAVAAGATSIVTANITDLRFTDARAMAGALGAPLVCTTTQLVTSGDFDTGMPTGQLAWATDTKELYYFNGSTWVLVTQTGAWASYTPTVTSTGTAPTGPTLVGRYMKVGKMVTGMFRATWAGIGAGASAGSGVYRFALPVAAAASHVVFDSLGTAIYQDAGTRQYIGSCDFVSTTTVGIELEGSVQVGANSPVSPANGDLIMGRFTYEAA